MEAEQQPRCQRFPLTKSKGAEKKEGKRRDIRRDKQQKQTEGTGDRTTGVRTSSHQPRFLNQPPDFLATFSRSSPLCGNLGRVEIEFDKRGN